MPAYRVPSEPAVRVAIANLFKLDATLGPKLKGDKVLDKFGVQPDQPDQPVDPANVPVPLPVIVLDSPTETASRVFNSRHGNALRVPISVWSAHLHDSSEAMNIYADIMRLLDEQRIILVGHEVVTGTIELVDCFPDTVSRAMHAIIFYSVTSRNV